MSFVIVPFPSHPIEMIGKGTKPEENADANLTITLNKSAAQPLD
jgi:hypothetical protein